MACEFPWLQTAIPYAFTSTYLLLLSIKAAFHETNIDTNSDTDSSDTPTSLRPTRARFPRDDPREESRVPVSMSVSWNAAFNDAGEQREPTRHDLPKLVYLEAVLKEAMRVKPVGPVVLRRAVDHDVIDGLPVPAGTQLIINLARMHRRPAAFRQPDRFHPERFLGTVGASLPF